jgi:tRNA (guanine37-N1)-methyltransferase
MRFHVITLFPEPMQAYLNDSILGRAQESKVISIKYYNPREFTKDKWARVDRRPYAGGPGMVLEAEPILKAVEKARGRTEAERTKRKKKTKIFFLAPEGKQFTNTYARQLAKKYDDIIFISGRYEGVDARVKKILKAEALTVGPYVLTGGELPSMIVIDAVARQIPGVLGKLESLEEDRTASPDVYTRPEVLEWKKKKYRVPKVLLSGDHKKIEEWKAVQLARTAAKVSLENNGRAQRQ